MKKSFDKLISKIEQRRSKALAYRISKNPHPTVVEYRLGIFIEMLEPQVEQAVLEMNKKGYSTDVSGFTETPGEQIIEGDFLLDYPTIKKLRNLGVLVEITSSSYTRLQFSTAEANILKIKHKWDTIVSFLPDKKQDTPPSMTRRAREFRTRYKR